MNKKSFSDYILFSIMAISIILFFFAFTIFNARFYPLPFARFHFFGPVEHGFEAKHLYFSLYTEIATLITKGYKKGAMFCFTVLGCVIEFFLAFCLFKLDKKLSPEKNNKGLHKILSLLLCLSSGLLVCETYTNKYAGMLTENSGIKDIIRISFKSIYGFNTFIVIVSILPSVLYFLYFLAYKFTKKSRCNKQVTLESNVKSTL